MACSLITSWQTDGEKVETVTDFIFLGYKITADSDWSHEIKTLPSWGKSLSGSSIHGVFQARVLEWIAISFSRGPSQPRDQTWVSHIASRRFTICATREAHDKPRQCIKKQRHYFVHKGPYSQIYDFSNSHAQVNSWTIKKAEHKRTDSFKLWCWRRLLRVPWTARRSNQSILK